MTIENLCEQFRVMLDAYHDGELDSVERDQVDAHLDHCADCRKELEQIGSTVSTLQMLPTLRPRVDFAAKIEALVADKTVVSTSACNAFHPLLDAFRDNELALEEKREVESHLAVCQDCNGALGDIDRVVASLKMLPPVPLKRDLAEEIEGLLAKKKKVVPFKRPLVWTSFGVAAAIALIVLCTHQLGGPVSKDTIASKPQSSFSRDQVAATPNNHTLPEIALLPQTSTEQLRVPPSETKVAEDQRSEGAAERLSGQERSQHQNTLVKNEKSSRVANASPADEAHIAGHISLDRRNATIASQAPPAGHDTGDKYGNLIALEAEPTTAEELGITTDEDGLYAIKL